MIRKDWISRIPVLRTYRDRDRAHILADYYRQRYHELITEILAAEVRSRQTKERE